MPQESFSREELADFNMRCTYMARTLAERYRNIYDELLAYEPVDIQIHHIRIAPKNVAIKFIIKKCHAKSADVLCARTTQ